MESWFNFVWCIGGRVLVRNHFLRAATPKGTPIEFVGAVSASGSSYSSSALSVSTDDLVVIYTSGKNGAFSSTTIGGTASLSLIQSSVFDTGLGGNDYLYDLQVYGVTSGGTITLTESGGQDVMGAAIAFNGGDSVSYDQDGIGSLETVNNVVSLSGIGSDDALLYIESHQDTSVYPTLPSGFTNTGGDELWQVGSGGAARDWSSRSGYLESPSASVSHTIANTGNDPQGAILLRIYKA
jgi:hypothetical protein